MNQTKKTIISGAGLIGPALAIALKRQGHDVHIFEKQEDIRNQARANGRSINLVLTAKGLKALADLKLLNDVKRITMPIIGRMMHSPKGELTFQPYGRDKSEHNLSVSRLELNKLLLQKAQDEGVQLNFNAPLERLDLKNKTAYFSEKKINYDLFFGADGAGSKSRKELDNFLAQKSLVEPLGVSYIELSMPPHKEMRNDCLHIWPHGDHMLMALANLDNSFTMTLYMTPQRYEKLKAEDSFKNYFQSFYPDAYKLMPDVLDELENHSSSFLGTLRSSEWHYQDQMALIGDAAHAMVPFFGQGTNCGLNDISILLRHMETSPSDWEKTLQNYSQDARKNAHAMQEMSIENWSIMSSKVADNEFLKQKAIERFIEQEFSELYRSRYGLITYTLTPYSDAFLLGKEQEKFLQEISSRTKDINNIDKDFIEKKLNKDFLPEQEKLNISIRRYNY